MNKILRKLDEGRFEKSSAAIMKAIEDEGVIDLNYSTYSNNALKKALHNFIKRGGSIRGVSGRDLYTDVIEITIGDVTFESFNTKMDYQKVFKEMFGAKPAYTSKPVSIKSKSFTHNIPNFVMAFK